jgi:hypothetical protein
MGSSKMTIILSKMEQLDWNKLLATFVVPKMERTSHIGSTSRPGDDNPTESLADERQASG